MLNPLREKLSIAGLQSQGRPSAFGAEAEQALAGFRSVRDDLGRQVGRGDLTVKVARERALAASADLRDRLLKQADAHQAVPRVFLDRLVEADRARKTARESLSVEGLQRETNRLLRLNLIEQQLQARAGEFEGRVFLRPVAGGLPSPTLDGLLGFHKLATDSGDEVAQEWARRQLEGFRNRAFDDESRRKIDLATDQPDRVNPRIVDAYVEALDGRGAEELETFTDRATAEGDANACIAAFVLARREPEGPSARWVRKVLASLPDFPDPAISTLRTLEAEARAGEAEASRAQAEFVIARAEAEATLGRLEAPNDAEVERQARIESRPLARPGEALGLALERRGSLSEADSQAMAGFEG